MHMLNLVRIKAQGLIWKTPKSIKDRSLSVFCYALPYHHMSCMGRIWLNNLLCLSVICAMLLVWVLVRQQSHLAQEGASGGWSVQWQRNLSGYKYIKTQHCKGLMVIAQSHAFGSVNWPTLKANYLVWVKLYKLCRVENYSNSRVRSHGHASKATLSQTLFLVLK